MLLGITIAWAAEAVKHSEFYSGAKGTVDEALTAYNTAHNTVGLLRTGSFTTYDSKNASHKVSYKDVDNDGVVFAGLNKYLDKRSEVIKIVSDSLEIADKEYLAWVKGGKKGTKEEPTLANILKKLGDEKRGADALKLGDTYINTVEAFTSIKTDLETKFTEDKVIEFFNAWYEVSNLNDKKPHSATNSGISKLQTSLNDCKTAINAVRNESWFKPEIDTENEGKNFDGLKENITKALEDADIDELRDLANKGNSIGNNILNTRDKVETAAHDALVDLYEKTLSYYNECYNKISSKYGQSLDEAALSKLQKEYADLYLTVLTKQNGEIDKANKPNPKTSCANYADIKKALEKVKEDLTKRIKTDVDDLERGVIEANNTIFNNWKAGLDENGKKDNDTYGAIRKSFITSSAKMDNYKSLVELYKPYEGKRGEGANMKCDDAMKTIRLAQSSLYKSYERLDSILNVVQKQLDAVNLDPTKYTTKYLSNYIESYGPAIQSIQSEIDKDVKEAMEAVRTIAVELVKIKALEVQTPNVWEVDQAYANELNNDEKVSATYEITTSSLNTAANFNSYVTKAIADSLRKIKISATEECNRNADKTISNISIDLIKCKDKTETYGTVKYESYWSTKGVSHLYDDGVYNMTYDDATLSKFNPVINADNCLAIIDEINKHVEDSLNIVKTLWDERLEKIRTEKAAIDSVSDLYILVSAYWDEAYHRYEGDNSTQTTLYNLRSGIDDIKAKFDEAIEKDKKANEDGKTPWKMGEVNTIMNVLVDSLKENYNKFYPYHEPEAAKATADAKKAAEDAIAALVATITEANTALMNATNAEDSTTLQNAIDAANKALNQANKSLAEGEEAMGSAADSSYNTAKTTADTAKAALEKAIEETKETPKVEGDLNGDGEVDGEDAAIAIENRSQADLLKVYKAILKK